MLHAYVMSDKSSFHSRPNRGPTCTPTHFYTNILYFMSNFMKYNDVTFEIKLLLFKGNPCVVHKSTFNPPINLLKLKIEPSLEKYLADAVQRFLDIYLFIYS